MNFKCLNVLAKNIAARVASLNSGALAAEVFYLHSKKWWLLNGREVTDRSSRQKLEGARRSASGFHRPATERNVYFWIKRFEVVVRVEFSSAIKVAAQSLASSTLDRIVEDSLNEYRATHDVHTGLRNRSAFDQALLDALQEVSPVGHHSIGDAKETSLMEGKSTVALASLDIDHFKAINDRFGHGYGDLVLAALAGRMEKVAARVQEESEARIGVQVFRLGGEEFQLLITGAITERDGVRIAQELAEEVRSQLLPSGLEYQVLSKMEFADGTPLPHDSDRRVTVSVGVAAVVSLNESPVDLSKRLKRQSDLALYSAKLGGRDRVRYFDEILNGSGRVTSVDKTNGVMSIDIGREVGVKKGQEFFVYPGGYDGETPFYSGEGRSRKRVGTYPRFRAARISAFDVQNEVSFCRLLAKEAGVVEVLEGATLEAIPLGSISHLVGEFNGNRKFSDQDSFRATVAEMADASDIVVLAVALYDIEKFSEDKGMDQANDCLGRVGLQILSFLGPKARYGQANLNSFLAVVAIEDGQVPESLASSLHSDIRSKVEDVALGVGWVFKPKDGKAEALESLNDSGGLVDVALLSALESSKVGEVWQFTAAVWNHSLWESRRSGQYNRALADYKLISDLGLTSAYADTQIAYIYMFGPDRNLEIAESHLRKAHSLEPELGMVKANLACFLISQDRFGEGSELFESFGDAPESYWLARFYGALATLSQEEFAQYVLERSGTARTAVASNYLWLRRGQADDVRKAINDVLVGVPQPLSV